jgi:hypothetical protein
MTLSTETPFADMIPMDPVKNMEWRIAIREKAARDPDLQKTLRYAAFRDVIFFLSAFCWLYEPRPQPKILPFIPWPHQIEPIKVIDRHLGAKDIGIDKSRGEGATWLILDILLRRWLRDPAFAGGLVSRNENVVDSKDDPDSLMWKLDWTIERLPVWLKPRGYDPKTHRNYTNHTIYNPQTLGTLVGFPTTGDAGRGGRKTAFFMDEMAAWKESDGYAVMTSTQHVTDCRIVASTFEGDSGAFYDYMTQESNCEKLVLDWKDNPTRNRGLYRLKNGQPEPIDPERNPLPPDYAKTEAENLSKLRRRGFLRDGQIRSPWYDNQCLRPVATPRSIAQELDRDPHGTIAKIFDLTVIARMERDEAQPPTAIGNLVYDRDTCHPQGLTPTQSGCLELWDNYGLRGSPPTGLYSIGADIAAGGAGDQSSNSAAVVTNITTGTQVAQYTTNREFPEHFARTCAALCKWFHNAYLTWEANGPTGAAFTKAIVDNIRYPNIYYRESSIEGLHRKTRNPGYWLQNDDAKLKIFGQLTMAMDDGDFRPRSADMLAECRQYKWSDKGKIVYTPQVQNDTSAGKGRAHGDRVVAAALSWVGCQDRPSPQEGTTEAEVYIDPPYGSMAWRDKQRAEWREAAHDPWTDSPPDYPNQTSQLALAGDW